MDPMQSAAGEEDPGSSLDLVLEQPYRSPQSDKEPPMATSPLQGVPRRPQTEAPGRDNDALGPSDTSDSGSDVAGLADLDPNDQDAPLDVAFDVDRQRPETALDALAPGADSDSSGTGERRSAGLDAGEREAADILPDHVTGGRGAIDDASAGELLARADDQDAEDQEGEEDEEDEENEDAAQGGDGSDEGANDEGDDVVQVPRR